MIEEKGNIEEKIKESFDEIKDWASKSSLEDIVNVDPLIHRILPSYENQNYPRLSRDYPEDFSTDEDYIETLPDLQNGPSSNIRGLQKELHHVGISNFKLPIKYPTKDGEDITLETSVTGTVSLEANKKGINMSRIMRSFYKHSGKQFGFDTIHDALKDYLNDLESFDARIQTSFSYPMMVESLRSGLSGYQYYDISLEMFEKSGERKKIIHLDYVYSSTCPCSLELSEHSRQYRNQLATPHSQRSVARISVESLGDECLWFEDLIDMCRKAIPTETQVMVKREDEQAFAELNAANPIFVEDAVRLFSEQLEKDHRIGDYQIIASHQESLHSHDAVSIMTHGETFDSQNIDPKLFNTLIHK